MKRLILIVLGIAAVVFVVSAIWFLSNNKSPVASVDVQVPAQPTQSDVVLDVKTKPYLTANNIPAGIYLAQIQYKTGEKFALVWRQSSNTYMPELPTNFKTNFAGVLQWNEIESTWEKFLQVQDADGKDFGNNNPMSLTWADPDGTDQVPSLTVVDSNGGGSGEGIAKVFQPASIDLEKWAVVDCYYWSTGERLNSPRFKLTDPQCKNASVAYVGN